MGTSATVLTPGRSTAAHDSGFASAMRTLDAVVGSAEPAVVFTSHVRLCVPLIADAAVAAVHESDKEGYEVSWPRDGVDVRTWPQDHTVVATVGMADTQQHAGYHASLTVCLAHPATGTDLLLAQLAIERAAARLDRERLTEAIAIGAARADGLELALSSSREIAIAMGILMSTHKLTIDQAFDLLRRVSQHTHRKVHDIAIEVSTTGAIDLPSAVSLIADPS